MVILFSLDLCLHWRWCIKVEGLPVPRWRLYWRIRSYELP